MKNCVTIFLLFLTTYTIAQAPRIKDDPILRQEFELRKLINPITGKIPANIRSLELEFAKSLSANSARSQDANTVWTHRGPFNVGGRTRALAVDVNDENLILGGGVSGGLWRTTNQGNTWTKVTDVSVLQSISCIAQDPRSGQTDTWYYGTGEQSGNSASGSGAFFLGDGIYKSTDNGLTWSLLAATESGSPEVFNTNSFELNNEIIVNPANGDVLVANFFGIQRSQDGGDSFSEVLDNPKDGWSDVATTSDGSVLYASMEGDGIYQSTDNGDTWPEITPAGFNSSLNGERIVLAIAPSNEDIVYVLGESLFGTSGHGLWKFDDSDDSWTNLTSNIPQLGGAVGDFDSQGGYDLIIEVKPDDENFVIIGGTNIYRSTDGFATTGNTSWVGGYSTLNNVSLYTNQHPDQHAFVFLSGNRALSGNDGGVQMAIDITETEANSDGETVGWTLLNNGYLTTQVYALSTGPGDQIMAGFQDNSTWLTTSASGTADWSDQFSGDGAYNAFNSDGTMRYMSAQNARIDRVGYSDANSETPTSFTQIDPSSGYSTSLFITPFYLDPVNDELLYLGGDFDLFVNTQASTSTQSAGWASISLGSSDAISEFGLTNANMVYAGTASGELFKVEDPGGASPTVTNVTGSNFSSGYISSIGVNSFDEDELIVTFSSYGVPSIFHSVDGGVSWADISGNLEENTDGSGSGPSVRATRILNDGIEYMVGTSTGLYSTRIIDGANTVWILEGSSNVGNVVINHIVSADNGHVVIGTHGNGLYSADVDLNLASPSEITLTNNIIAEDEPSGTSVGTFSTVDTDDNQHTYSLVDGEGGDDNSSFDVIAEGLISAEVFDFSVKSNYTIRVQTEDDDGNVFAKSFAIVVSDVLSVDRLDEDGITMFPNPFKNHINLEMVNDYRGEIDITLLSLDGKTLIQERVYHKNNQRTQSLLDLSFLPSGNYLIKFQLGDREISSKLIKE